MIALIVLLGAGLARGAGLLRLLLILRFVFVLTLTTTRTGRAFTLPVIIIAALTTARAAGAIIIVAVIGIVITIIIVAAAATAIAAIVLLPALLTIAAAVVAVVGIIVVIAIVIRVALLIVVARLLLFLAGLEVGLHAEIMIGELQIIFRVHAIIVHLRILRELLVFFQKLSGIAAGAIVDAVLMIEPAATTAIVLLTIIIVATSATAVGLTIVHKSCLVPILKICDPPGALTLGRFGLLPSEGRDARLTGFILVKALPRKRPKSRGFGEAGQEVAGRAA